VLPPFSQRPLCTTSYLATSWMRSVNTALLLSCPYGRDVVPAPSAVLTATRRTVLVVRAYAQTPMNGLSTLGDTISQPVRVRGKIVQDVAVSAPSAPFGRSMGVIKGRIYLNCREYIMFMPSNKFCWIAILRRVNLVDYIL
jgi:hypothetical protein